MDTRSIRDEELPVFCLDHHFTLGSVFLAEGMEGTVATCDLMVRDMPAHRNFLVAGGLEAIIQFIQNLHYSEKQIQYLLKFNRISEKFAEYLHNFRFTGDIEAMPEGTVHFPGEPMLRITAPIIQTVIITDQLISLANIDTLFLTKLARLQLAADGTICSLGTVRAQGIDSGWRVVRNTQFFDRLGFANVAVGIRLDRSSANSLNANHAFIKSFPTEIEAMRAVARHSPNSLTLMVDTYNFEQGVENAIKVADELKLQGKQLLGVMIDSGDMLELTKYTRERFDQAGHPELKISLAGNLDEYKIAKFKEQGVKADIFAVVTEVVTCADSPKMETVYKVAQLERDGEVQHTAKFAPGKKSLPGKKQVFRQFKNGLIEKDTIGLESEDLGEKLLIPIFRNGDLVYKCPNDEDRKAYVRQQLDSLPAAQRSIFDESLAPLEISDEIKRLTETVRSQHQAKN